MSSGEDTKLIRYYGIVRNSVEHFDKLLAHFRQIMFAFNGIFIGVGITYVLNELNIKNLQYIKVFLISNLFAVVNILIWLLEKHYHRYLIVSAKVANKIEEELFLGDKEKYLTYQLSCVKEYRVQGVKFLWRSLRSWIPWLIECLSRLACRISSVIRTYDFIYLLPILTSLLCNLLLGYSAKGRQTLGWVLPISWVLAIVYLMVGTVILSYNYSFEKSFSAKQ
jgi:hypothetical protein